MVYTNLMFKRFRFMPVVYLFIALVVGGFVVFTTNQTHRAQRLSKQAQTIAIPDGCKQVKQEFIGGEFTPQREILSRHYDCAASKFSIDEVVKFYKSKGYGNKFPGLKSYTYLLAKQDNGYYTQVSFNSNTAVIGIEKFVTLQTYTGFGKY